MVALREKVNPVTDGVTKLTLPLNPKLETATIDVAEPPATRLAGLAVEAFIVKSPPTLRETRIEWMSDPLVPVTLIE